MPSYEHYATSLEQQRDQCSSSESYKSSPFSIINAFTDADFQLRSNGSILTHNRLKMTKIFYDYSRWFEFHQNSPHLEKKMTRALSSADGCNQHDFHGYSTLCLIQTILSEVKVASRIKHVTDSQHGILHASTLLKKCHMIWNLRIFY